MPEIILNVSGTTRTTGTANPVISGVTGTSGPMTDVPDGTEVFYVRRYSSNKPGFENCIGIWRSATDTIERTSVEKSSNGGGAVVWGVGEQTIDISISPDMIVADDDPRLVSEDVDDLTPATSIDGTEKAAFSQGGDPVSITPSLILADPYRQKKTHLINRARGYSAFDKMRPNYVGSVDGSIVELEPFVLYRSGTGAQATNALSFLFVPSLLLETGSTDTGYSVVQHTDYPYLFINTNDLDMRLHFYIPTLPTGAQDYTIQIGFVIGAPALAAAGIYLELTSASPNWFQCVKNAAGTTRVDTGIAATTSATTARIAYSAAATESRFWINGVATTPIDDGTRVVDAFTFLAMVAGIRKSNGIVTRSIVLLHHLYDNAKGAVPHFA